MQYPRVDVPKPQAPDSGDIIDRGNELSGWFAGRESAFWTILLIAGVAALVMVMLKRPFVRGLVVGGVILAVAIAAFVN